MLKNPSYTLANECTERIQIVCYLLRGCLVSAPQFITKELRKKMKLISVFVFVCLLFTGCASIISGVNQDITFNSNPEGAKVYLNGKIVGVTPFTFSAKKNKYDTMRIEKEGYVTINRDLNKTFDGVALINIFWDLSTTDAITGAIFKYEENSYFIEMTPEG